MKRSTVDEKLLNCNQKDSIDNSERRSTTLPKETVGKF
jgi:hypothetical protein